MVNEMKAANIQTVIGVTIFLTITLLGLSFIRYKKRDIPVRYLLLFLGMSYLSLSAIRGLLFLAICGIFPLAFLYRNVRIPEFGKANPFKIRRSLVVLTVLVVLAAVLMAGAAEGGNGLEGRVAHDPVLWSSGGRRPTRRWRGV